MSNNFVLTFSIVLWESGHDYSCPLVIMVMWFTWVIWEEFVLKNILQKATQRPTKFHIFLQMGEMVIMNDLEWPMLSYYVIYYEKLRKVMHRTDKVALTIYDEQDNIKKIVIKHYLGIKY